MYISYLLRWDELSITLKLRIYIGHFCNRNVTRTIQEAVFALENNQNDDRVRLIKLV